MTTTTRRAFLASLAASGVLTACGDDHPAHPDPIPTLTPTPTSTPTPTPTPTPPRTEMVPLTIDLTQANLPAGTPAYAYIVGGYVTDPTPAPSPISNYRLDASGGIHLMKTTDNNQAASTFPGSNQLSPADAATIATNYPDAWADYSIPLSLTSPTVIDISAINSTNLPGLGVGTNALSARIYISLGIPKLPFTVLAASTTSPNPFAGPSLDANAVGALCLYDWFEFSITGPGPSTPAGILNGNSTQVDQYALPLTISATPGGTTEGALNLTRTALMNDLNTLPAPLNGILTLPVTVPAAYPAGMNYLRALSPDHIAGLGGGGSQFQTYFDAVISQWYTNWSTKPIVVTDTATGTYSGMNVGGSLIFIPGNYATQTAWNTANSTTPAGDQINFGAITTANIWQCNGLLASGSTAQQNIGKQILAAFNRGVMSYALDDGNCPAATTFYPSGVPSNQWAYSFHQWNTNKLAYGFAYDDVCNQNPSLQTSSSLTALNITLGAIS